MSSVGKNPTKESHSKKPKGDAKPVASRPAFQNAQALAEAGLPVFPLRRNAKEPRIKNWPKAATTDLPQIKTWAKRYPECNWGLMTGSSTGIFALDVDGPTGKTSLADLKSEHGKLPPTVTVQTRRGKHLYFRAPDGNVATSAGKIAKGIDVRGSGGYVVAAGGTHPDGGQYRYKTGRGIGEVPIAEAPGWLLGLLAKKPSPSNAVAGAARTSPKPDKRLVKYVKAVAANELRRLKNAPTGTRNTTLNSCAFKLGQIANLGVLDIARVKADLRAASTELGLEADEIEATLASGWSAGEQNPRSIVISSKGQPRYAEEQASPASEPLTKRLAVLGENDSDNGRRFAVRNEGRMCYSPGFGWMHYDGKVWKSDTDGDRFHRADEAIALIAEEVTYLAGGAEQLARRKFANASKSNSARNRMIDAAQHLLTVPASHFDRDIYAFNTFNGTINLQTGQLFPHDARDYITHLAAVAYDPSAMCPLFKAVLSKALRKNVKLMKVFRRLVGYSMTGNVSAQCFAFIHGPGQTSKSTIVNTIRGMVGDYGKHMPADTLLAKKVDSTASNDLARLKGARMVTAIETNFGRELDEAKIKAMTGGEPVTARLLYKEFIEFQPEFKLWMVSNEYPKVRDTSEAFWRRVKVIPFTVEVSQNERDEELPQKLKAEWPGILAWAVRGAVGWARKGFGSSKAISKAIATWRQAQDHVDRFIKESCIIDPKATEMSEPVFRLYGEWCKENGEQPLSQQKLKAKLQSLSFTHRRTKRGSEWRGFKLRTKS